MGQKYLASGKRVSMRLWEAEPSSGDKPPSRREYETVGYVIGGRAELYLADQKVTLEPGDSWLVPPQPSTATPSWSGSRRSKRRHPAEVHGRDESD